MMGIAWSPDGKSLVFADAPEVSALWVLSVETLQRRPLATETRCLLAGHPAFSPDGRTLAFTCSQDYAAYAIYTVPKEGGRATQIAQMMGIPQGITWSRDGARLVFSNDPGVSEGRLWSVDLTTHRLEALPLSEDARQPAFSPDGTRLAFVRGSDNVNIWKLDAPSYRNARRFIASTRIQHSPRYSPDGRHIAFQSTRSGAHEVWLADADGSNPVAATHFNSGISGSPRWCSDSRRIAFDSRLNGPSSVYIEDILERVPRRIQTNLAEISLPTWSQDCHYLYVVAGAAKTALYRVPAQGGEAALVHNGVAINASESADGRALFFADAFENARIQQLTPEQGDVRPLAGMPRVRDGTSWEVTRDGIYFVDAGSPQAAIGHFEFATGSARELARMSHPIVPWTGLSVSPLDRSLLYSQTDEKSSEIMLAEFGNGAPSRAGTHP
jgi:Tol biopolymer transport system component